jgi:MFS family permease
MAIGFVTFATIEEPPKEKVQKKEKSFKEFLKNSTKVLKSDKRLQQQIITILLSYAYLISMPFVILNANNSITLTGWMLGSFISVQMIGSIIGSSFIWKKIHDYEKMLTLSFVFMIVAFIIALFAKSAFSYALIFFIFGMGLDGNKISGMNLVIEIAPEEKRPIYTALQANITSLGLFFPVLGGIILKMIDNYQFLYIITITILAIGLYKSRHLKESL